MSNQDKKTDGKFRKKHINHDPKTESTKATFDKQKMHDHDPSDFKL